LASGVKYLYLLCVRPAISDAAEIKIENMEIKSKGERNA
jgi:hypothetical protein